MSTLDSVGNLSDRDKALVRFAMRAAALMVCDCVARLIPVTPIEVDGPTALRAAVDAARKTTEQQWPEYKA